jgi:hypothetical protein
MGQICDNLYTGVAQLVEQWSPKPEVVSSNLTTRATKKCKADEQIEDFYR